jgi:hypothetical protein
MKPSGFDTRREAAGIETRLLEYPIAKILP